MKCLVISHKVCWRAADDANGHLTDGGFPLQMEAISELFDSTVLLLPVQSGPAPEGLTRLKGRQLSVQPVEEPPGSGWRRKALLPVWLLRHWKQIQRAVATADALHAPVPGDVGSLGILMGLARRKPMFIRHCGTWGEPETWADRTLFWLLNRIGGGRRVVFATGGGDGPPSHKNPDIRWIFSTSMRSREIETLRAARAWRPGTPLRLILVSRQERVKNTDMLIKALALLRRDHDVRLDVVGDGSCLPDLRTLARELGMESAVVFHGRISHERVLTTLQSANIFCFPTSCKEGFPKAVHEAMAVGLPIVTTGVSVLPQLVGLDCGVVIPDIRPETIEGAIRALMADPRTLAKMGEAAREKARAYTLERWAETIRVALKERWGELRMSKMTEEATA
jgi:glycosyltransferase involved in cell wall biosynthesis